MRMLSPKNCILAVVLAVFPALARAQTYTCLPDTATDTQIMHDVVVSIVTGTSQQAQALRQAYNLPAVAASKVTVVTTSSVCRQAGDAYHVAVAAPGAPAISRTLVLIKVGSTRYVVTDPSETGGARSAYNLHVVFDTKWKFLIGFAS